MDKHDSNTTYRQQQAQHWYLKGNSYFQNQRFSLALKSFRKAIHLDPTHPKSHFKIALIYAMSEMNSFENKIPEMVTSQHDKSHFQENNNEPIHENDIGLIHESDNGQVDSCSHEFEENHFESEKHYTGEVAVPDNNKQLSENIHFKTNETLTRLMDGEQNLHSDVSPLTDKENEIIPIDLCDYGTPIEKVDTQSNHACIHENKESEENSDGDQINIESMFTLSKRDEENIEASWLPTLYTNGATEILETSRLNFNRNSVNHLTVAATLGYSRAQFHLGIINLIEGDTFNALKWFLAAARQNHLEARNQLQILVRRVFPSQIQNNSQQLSQITEEVHSFLYGDENSDCYSELLERSEHNDENGEGSHVESNCNSEMDFNSTNSEAIIITSTPLQPHPPATPSSPAHSDLNSIVSRTPHARIFRKNRNDHVVELRPLPTINDPNEAETQKSIPKSIIESPTSTNNSQNSPTENSFKNAILDSSKKASRIERSSPRKPQSPPQVPTLTVPPLEMDNSVSSPANKDTPQLLPSTIQLSIPTPQRSPKSNTTLIASTSSLFPQPSKQNATTQELQVKSDVQPSKEFQSATLSSSENPAKHDSENNQVGEKQYLDDIGNVTKDILSTHSRDAKDDLEFNYSYSTDRKTISNEVMKVESTLNDLKIMEKPLPTEFNSTKEFAMQTTNDTSTQTNFEGNFSLQKMHSNNPSIRKSHSGREMNSSSTGQNYNTTTKHNTESLNPHHHFSQAQLSTAYSSDQEENPKESQIPYTEYEESCEDNNTHSNQEYLTEDDGEYSNSEEHNNENSEGEGLYNLHSNKQMFPNFKRSNEEEYFNDDYKSTISNAASELYDTAGSDSLSTSHLDSTHLLHSINMLKDMNFLSPFKSNDSNLRRVYDIQAQTENPITNNETIQTELMSHTEFGVHFAPICSDIFVQTADDNVSPSGLSMISRTESISQEMHDNSSQTTSLTEAVHSVTQTTQIEYHDSKTQTNSKYISSSRTTQTEVPNFRNEQIQTLPSENLSICTQTTVIEYTSTEFQTPIIEYNSTQFQTPIIKFSDFEVQTTPASFSVEIQTTGTSSMHSSMQTEQIEFRTSNQQKGSSTFSLNQSGIQTEGSFVPQDIHNQISRELHFTKILVQELRESEEYIRSEALAELHKKAKQANQLQAKLEMILKEKHSLVENVQRLKSDNLEYQEQIEAFSKTISEQKNIISEFSSRNSYDIQNLRKENEELKHQLSQSLDREKLMETVDLSTNTKLTNAKSQIDELQTLLQKKDAEMLQLQQRMQSYENKLLDNEMLTKDMELELSHFRKENSEQYLALQRLDDEILSRDEQLQKSKEETLLNYEKIENQQRTIKQLEEEIALLKVKSIAEALNQNHNATIENLNQSHKSRCLQLEKQLDKHKEQKEILEGNLEAANKRIETLTDKKKKLKIEIEKLHTQISTLDARLQESEIDKSKRDKDSIELETQRLYFERKLQEMQSLHVEDMSACQNKHQQYLNEEIVPQIQELRDLLDKEKEANNEKVQTIQSLQEKLKKIIQHRRESREQVEHWREMTNQRLNTLKEEYNARIKQYKIDLSQKEVELQKMRKKLSRVVNHVDSVIDRQVNYSQERSLSPYYRK